MKNFERLMNFFTGRGIFILITSIILLVVAIMETKFWNMFWIVVDSCMMEKRTDMLFRMKKSQIYWNRSL